MPVPTKYYAIFHQSIKYTITGGAAFISDYAIYWLVSLFFHYQTATFSGLITGIIVNFILSKFWVFEDKKTISKREVFLFLAVTGFGFALTAAGMYISVEVLDLHDKIARIIVAIIIFIMNFFARKFIIFRKV